MLTGNPVSSDLAQAFPATFELATLAVIISTFVGVPLGLVAALFRDSFIDKIARVVALVGHSIPVFWFGIVGLVIFYAGLNWVGGPGRIDVFYEGLVTPQTGLLLIDSLLQGETEIFWNALGHIILPAIILAYAAMAYITRMERELVADIVDHCRAGGDEHNLLAGDARRQGVADGTCRFQHQLANLRPDAFFAGQGA